MAIQLQPMAQAAPVEAQLVPNPALGNYLGRRFTNEVIRINENVKETGVTFKEFVLRSVAQIVLGIALVILGIASVHTGVGALGLAAGIALILDGLRNGYKAYKEYNMSVIDEATHSLVEQHVRHPERAIAGANNHADQAQLIQQAVNNALIAQRQAQAAAAPAPAPAPFNPAALFGPQVAAPVAAQGQAQGLAFPGAGLFGA